MKYLILFSLLAFSTVTFAQSQFRYEGYIENGGTPVSATAQRFTVSLKKPSCASNLGLTTWDSGATVAIVNGEFNLVPSFSESLLSAAMDPSSTFGCTAGSARNLEITWVDQSRTFLVALQDAPRSSFSNLAGNSNTLNSRTQDQFLKIDDYPTQPSLSNAQVNSLLNLVNGTSALYSNSASTAGGDASGTLGALTVTGLRGRSIGSAAPAVGHVLKFDGTSWVPSADDAGAIPGDASYAAKGVVQFDTSASTSGIQVTAGVASLANTITASGPVGSASTVPIITYDSKGRLTNVTTLTINDSTKLPLAGGTMTGPVDMGMQNITNANSVAATNFSGRNLVINDNDSNKATIGAPVNLLSDYTLTLPTNGPTSGFVLSTDASGQLSWISPASGTVTAVNATAPITSSSGPTPLISLATGLGANQVPQVGGTGLGANGLVVTNGLGTALTSLNCSVNQVIKFDASGFATCGTDSGGTGTEFVTGGNSFSAPATIGTNDNFALNFETNGTSKVTVLPNGNVGIGTTNPGRIVSVFGSNPNDHALEIVNQSSSSAAYSSLYLGNDVNVGDAGMYLNSSTNTADGGTRSLNLFSLAGNITLSSNGGERMRILASTGNVGIGTTTPATRLDVSGAVRIGNDASACTSGLAGSIRYNASLVEYCNGGSWQAFGLSGPPFSVAGTNNIYLGLNAGGTTPSGSTNVGVGAESLFEIVAGTDNTAIGYQSGRSIASGVKNTLVGSVSGIGLTTGSSNTLIGNNAGSTVTTGNNNTFVGVDSGKLLASGDNNIILGSNSGSEIAGQNNRILISDGAGNIRMSADSAGQVGFGVINPLSTIHISRDFISTIMQDSYYNTSGGETALLSRRARGTKTSPTPVQSGDILGGWGVVGYDGVTMDTQTSAGIYAVATEPFSTTNNGTQLSIFTTDNGSNTKAERVRIASNGNVGIGTTTPGATLDVNGTFKVGTDGTPISKIIRCTGVPGGFTTLGVQSSTIVGFTCLGATVGMIAQCTYATTTDEAFGLGKVMIQGLITTTADAVRFRLYNISTTAVNTGPYPAVTCILTGT